MLGEQQAGCAGGLRGKAEAPRHELRFHLDLRQRGDEGSCLQTFLECPGCIERSAPLDDQQERRVDPERKQARPVRPAPFARGVRGQAPEERRSFAPVPREPRAEKGQREGDRRGLIGIGLSFDLVQPGGFELRQRKRLPPPGRGKAQGEA